MTPPPPFLNKVLADQVLIDISRQIVYDTNVIHKSKVHLLLQLKLRIKVIGLLYYRQ